MRRTTPWAALGLLSLTLLTPTYAASAAAQTCHGEAATLVGAPRTSIEGTEGRDVVVTNGSRTVKTLGGDDLVCITGRDARPDTVLNVNIDTGAGNDVVDGTAADSWGAVATLGDGADRFEGGAADDEVVGGYYAWEGDKEVAHDTEVDVIIGGAGSDGLVGGEDGQPNSDVLMGGAGNDGFAFSGTFADGAVIDGGKGKDDYSLYLEAGAHRVDNVAGEWRTNGALNRRWSSLESFSVYDAAEGATLEFAGSDAPETIYLFPQIALVADLGGGADTVLAPTFLPAQSRLDAGRGRDRFELGSQESGVEWDLREGTVVGDQHSFTAAGFEDTFVSSPRAHLIGTNGPNVLEINSCDGRLDGRGGKDDLQLHSDLEFEYKTCVGSATFIGGKGNDKISSKADSKDRMIGGAGNDRFYASSANDQVLGGPGDDRASLDLGRDRFDGGPGRDKVEGGKGRDTCRAEVKVDCER